ncbi:23833_t:CDS:1, partial [Racocetra persica]
PSFNLSSLQQPKRLLTRQGTINNEKNITNSPRTLLQSKSSASTILSTNSSRASLQLKSPTSNILTMLLQLSQTAQSTISIQLTNLNNSLQSISLTKKRKANTATSDFPTTSTSNKFSKQSSMSF